MSEWKQININFENRADDIHYELKYQTLLKHAHSHPYREFVEILENTDEIHIFVSNHTYEYSPLGRADGASTWISAFVQSHIF